MPDTMQPVSLDDLPLPPPELRKLAGGDGDFWHQLSLGVLDTYDPAIWRSILDFGCGPGRLTREVLAHEPRPRRYVGIDLDLRGISWVAAVLAPIAHELGVSFDIAHHDVHHRLFNPGGVADILPLPLQAHTVSLLLAHSVFTHLNESHALQYLHEIGRVLTIDGLVYVTWYLIDRDDWPALGTSNSLYISAEDPGAAVMYDRGWVRETARAAGLKVVRVVPPPTRHHQWRVILAREGSGYAEVEWPPLDSIG